MSEQRSDSWAPTKHWRARLLKHPCAPQGADDIYQQSCPQRKARKGAGYGEFLHGFTGSRSNKNIDNYWAIKARNQYRYSQEKKKGTRSYYKLYKQINITSYTTWFRLIICCLNLVQFFGFGDVVKSSVPWNFNFPSCKSEIAFSKPNSKRVKHA